MKNNDLRRRLQEEDYLIKELREHLWAWKMNFEVVKKETIDLKVEIERLKEEEFKLQGIMEGMLIENAKLYQEIANTLEKIDTIFLRKEEYQDFLDLKK